MKFLSICMFGILFFFSSNNAFSENLAIEASKKCMAESVNISDKNCRAEWLPVCLMLPSNVKADASNELYFSKCKEQEANMN